LGDYSSSGDGYISYTSSATANTDETKNQTLTTSPESFRNSTGWWKVKVTGVKSTVTQFTHRVDLVEFKPTYNTEYTVSTEFTFSDMTTATPLTLNFTSVSQYDLASVNVTIQVYNYTGSSYVTSGEGYLNYTSSSTPNTDETKVLNLTTNPENYVSSGNAKIKVTGVKDYQPNQKMNQLKLNYEYARWTTHYPDSYNVLNGTYVSGSLPSSVNSVDADYFIVRSEATDTSFNVYNPTDYTLLGSTSWVSGSVSNLTSDDDVYMTLRSYARTPTSTSYFPTGYTLLDSTSLVSGTVDNLDTDDGSYMTLRSYATGSSSTQYAHNETQNIGGTDYYTMKTDSADGPAVSLEADASFATRVSFGNYTYSLLGVSSIPSGSWTFYYRASKNLGSIVYHCDVDIKIRMANGTVRQTIATNVANSTNVTETSPTYETVNGTYSFPGYTVINQTDYLEIDYYADISTGQSGKLALLRIDDNSLATSDQTRLEGTIPADFVCEVELTGKSNIFDGWTQLFWNADQAFTLGTVNVTMQLYNYTLGDYPTNGDGYINFNSSSTPNTDETKNQTITSPEDFRNEGGWKLKIRAFKNSSSSFDMKVDLAEYKPSYGSETNQSYNPSGYTLLGSTTLSGGSVSNLGSNDESYMTFEGYATGNSSTLYVHNETRSIASNSYYELTINPADIAGVTLQVGTDTLGRQLFSNWTYPLRGVLSIPSGTWTFYYRTKLSSAVPVSHCDVDILVRMANGTVRQTIATDVANSSDATNTWQTLSGTYNFPGYTVVNQTDYLEIDFYGDVTTVKSGATNDLQIDDNGLAYADQTRLEGTVPVDYVCEVELTGSSNDYDWEQLVWNVDSAWTNASIDVTMQVYNYTLGDYPSSGDGYISYTSSGTPNTDETKNQTITTSPESFRNATDWWKIKIKGVKNNSTIFELKVDWTEYEPTYVNQYICEVELYGSSNTYDWQQLFWNIDSAWTTGSVSATLQLYNYTLIDYSRSGDGYINYTSSATPNTDETKNQTITTSPESFRNSTGWWKIRITGDKITTYTFDLKVDLTQYNATHYSEYTVSTEFTFSGLPTDTPFELNFTAVSQCDIATTNVTIQVYNYTGSTYPTSGDGYLTYNSSATPSTDENKNQTIDTNPQFYTSSGAAKIKITAVKTTITQFQQKTNQLKLYYGRGTAPESDQDFDYVLKAVEKEDSNWKVRLKVYDDNNKTRLDNCTIYFYGSQSQPVTNMNFTSNADGWSSAHSGNGTATYTWTEVTWDSGNGNPSPGSAGGSAYGGVSESGPGKQLGTVIYNFSYTFTAPTSGWTSVTASFAWKFTASGTYGNNILNSVKLILTDNSTGADLEELYVDDNSGSGWTGQASVGYYYRTGITVSASMTAGNNYKLKVQFTDTDTVNADDPSLTFRIDDVGITFNYGTSNQIIIISGSYIQQTGPLYDLIASGTFYIAMHAETSSVGTSYVYVYLEIYEPNTTVYARYIITFEIT